MLVNSLRAVVNSAILYCMEAARSENGLIVPSTYIACVAELLSPLVRALEEGSMIRELFEKLGISLDEVLGGAVKAIPVAVPAMPPPGAPMLPAAARLAQIAAGGGKPSPEEIRQAVHELLAAARGGG